MPMLASLNKRLKPCRKSARRRLRPLEKRKLVNLDTWKTYTLSKGPKFALEKKKAVTDLTHEMLQQ